MRKFSNCAALQRLMLVCLISFKGLSKVADSMQREEMATTLMNPVHSQCIPDTILRAFTSRGRCPWGRNEDDESDAVDH